MSACDQLRLVASGEMTPSELRDAGIEACAAANLDLGFVVSPLFDRAPAGVPMLLKDAGQELAGSPHFVGLAALRDVSSTSTRTTFLAQRFEEVGFSIIAKAACPPLAGSITTEPPGFAPARNPWDLSRSTGGSSGGSAAAVASGAVAIAHGSDATGSLRCPAGPVWSGNAQSDERAHPDRPTGRATSEHCVARFRPRAARRRSRSDVSVPHRPARAKDNRDPPSRRFGSRSGNWNADRSCLFRRRCIYGGTARATRSHR